MLEVTNKTRWKLTPNKAFLFKKIALPILGTSYDLSLVVCTDKLSEHNVLAYPLSKTEGEILLNPFRKGDFNIAYLFLHACIHLKGLDHGPKMDAFESKFLLKLKLTPNSL